jgi:hypothetical protein
VSIALDLPEPEAQPEPSVSLGLELLEPVAVEPADVAALPGEAAPGLGAAPFPAEPEGVPAPPGGPPPASETSAEITLERPLPRQATFTYPADAAGLVGAYLVSPRGSEERAFLLGKLSVRAEEVAPILCEQLPGPLDVEPEALSRTPAAEQGPVLAAVAALGLAAQKPLRAMLSEPDPARRRAAAALLGQAGDPGAFLPLADRCFDADPAVAEAARQALAQQRRHPGLKGVPEKLRRALLSGLADKAAGAARAIGALRDTESIPLLIQALEGSDGATATAASDALSAITLQRHGPVARAWLLWWKQNRGRTRADWLFGALTSGDRELRLQAATELRDVAPSPVTYSADLPDGERQEAARSWAEWFERGGHHI